MTIDMDMIKKSTASRRAFILAGAAAAVFGPISCSAPPATFLSREALLSEIGELSSALFAALADTILPATESPPASAVGADTFVVQVVTETRGLETNQRFFRGARTLATEAERQLGMKFENAGMQSRESFLKDVLGRTDEDPAFWFLYRFRELALVGWALSEETAKSAFNYQRHIYQYNPRTSNQEITLQSHLDRMYVRI